MDADSRARRIESLLTMIPVRAQEIRQLRSDIEQPRILNERIAAYRSQIATLQIKLANDLHRQANLQPMLDSVRDDIAAMRQELGLLQAAEEIEKFKQLQAEIEKLKNPSR